MAQSLVLGASKGVVRVQGLVGEHGDGLVVVAVCAVALLMLNPALAVVRRRVRPLPLGRGRRRDAAGGDHVGVFVRRACRFRLRDVN
ncbi:hypothetical protein [Saccharothrix sp. NRRL B-16348]|uniref:hypothetical protein n=1 Tax=Saccharothrix sp. NRRL B-16348 TaxID=1415542 RepID=UPI0012FA1D73|nr:hypothetical protein [Saccharothrix sp. NRRL B-16348]